MTGIFNAVENTKLIERINTLTEYTPALWGKMDAAQMMAHMQLGMNMAFGNTPKKRHWIGRVFGSLGKRRMLKKGDFDRLMPTFTDFEITGGRDFEQEKTKLIALVKEALTKGQGSLVKYPHPYFGAFKNDEWARLNRKHFDHHLRQFGV